jgi:hypothetical protein
MVAFCFTMYYIRYKMIVSMIQSGLYVVNCITKHIKVAPRSDPIAVKSERGGGGRTLAGIAGPAGEESSLPLTPSSVRPGRGVVCWSAGGRTPIASTFLKEWCECVCCCIARARLISPSRRCYSPLAWDSGGS